MIVILNSTATKNNVQELVAELHSKGLKTNLSEGSHTTIVVLSEILPKLILIL